MQAIAPATTPYASWPYPECVRIVHTRRYSTGIGYEHQTYSLHDNRTFSNDQFVVACLCQSHESVKIIDCYTIGLFPCSDRIPRLFAIMVTNDTGELRNSSHGSFCRTDKHLIVMLNIRAQLFQDGLNGRRFDCKRCEYAKLDHSGVRGIHGRDRNRSLTLVVKVIKPLASFFHW